MIGAKLVIHSALLTGQAQLAKFLPAPFFYTNWGSDFILQRLTYYPWILFEKYQNSADGISNSPLNYK